MTARERLAERRKATARFFNRVGRAGKQPAETVTITVSDGDGFSSVSDARTVPITLPKIVSPRVDNLARIDARLAYLKASPPRVE